MLLLSLVFFFFSFSPDLSSSPFSSSFLSSSCSVLGSKECVCSCCKCCFCCSCCFSSSSSSSFLLLRLHLLVFCFGREELGFTFMVSYFYDCSSYYFCSGLWFFMFFAFFFFLQSCCCYCFFIFSFFVLFFDPLLFMINHAVIFLT